MIDSWKAVRWGAVGLVTALTVLACGAQSAPNSGSTTATDVGITKDEIKIGSTFPQTGPANFYSAVGKGMSAYFKYVNAEKGGVNGRKINFIIKDDAYTASQTAIKARELVQEEKVFAVFGALGTGPNLGVRQFYNDNQVPQLFVFTGSDHWGNDWEQYKWTLGWQPDYEAEGKIYAKDILKNLPNTKIAVLYQNDEYGKDYLNGMTKGLGDKASSMIIAKATYNAGDPTDMSSQVNVLKASGADTFYVVTTPGYSVSALVNAISSGWKPAHIYLNNVGASSVYIKNVVAKLGNPHAMDGVITTTYTKDPNDPAQKDDPGIKKYREILAKYQPDCDPIDASCVTGMAAAFSTVDVLTRAGQNLTRANVRDIAATKMNETDNFLLLPGIVVKTTKDDHFPIRQERLQKWDTDHYVPYGELISGR